MAFPSWEREKMMQELTGDRLVAFNTFSPLAGDAVNGPVRVCIRGGCAADSRVAGSCVEPVPSRKDRLRFNEGNRR